MEKLLGKIDMVKFGIHENCLGLYLVFLAQGIGVSTCIYGGVSTDIKIDENTKWTEEDRNAANAKLLRKLNDLMCEAKVTDVYKLQGKPVELTVEDRQLKSFRILTEVL